MHLLYRLSRCPLCRERASSSLGCCERCAASLFQVEVMSHQLLLGTYRGKLKEAVQALKYRHVTRLSGLFGKALASEVKKQGWRPDVVCPVPLYLFRRLERGYNQAGLIARVVARELELPCQTLLSRKRATRRQILLSRDERADNVAGAFVSRRLQGEVVLLIDDVVTSGATVTECSLALLEGGASRVYLAAVAGAVQAGKAE